MSIGLATPVKDSVIGSLALLKSSLLPDDFVSTYIPFIATLLFKNKMNSIDADKLMVTFKDEYGFIIPRAPFLAILSRCIKAKIIYKVATEYRVNIPKCQENSFTEKSREEAGKYSIIVNALQKYCENSLKKS